VGADPITRTSTFRSFTFQGRTWESAATRRKLLLWFSSSLKVYCTRMYSYESELERMHGQLYILYRAGSRDQVKIDGLWARIERLQTMQAKLMTGGQG